MKQEIASYMIITAFLAFLMWIFLFVVAGLTCESHKRFDAYFTRLELPWNCYVSEDGVEFHQIRM